MIGGVVESPCRCVGPSPGDLDIRACPAWPGLDLRAAVTGAPPHLVGRSGAPFLGARGFPARRPAAEPAQIRASELKHTKSESTRPTQEMVSPSTEFIFSIKPNGQSRIRTSAADSPPMTGSGGLVRLLVGEGAAIPLVTALLRAWVRQEYARTAGEGPDGRRTPENAARSTVAVGTGHRALPQSVFHRSGSRHAVSDEAAATTLMRLKVCHGQRMAHWVATHPSVLLRRRYGVGLPLASHHVAIWARDTKPSLARMFSTCVSTVRGDSASWDAI